MKRSMIIVAVACLCLGFPGTEGRGEAPPEGDFSLLWSEDFALLRATNAPVNAILLAIGRAAGIPMALDAHNEETISLDLFFEINEIEDVERLILAVWPSTIVTYEAMPDDGGYLIAGVKTTSRVDRETTLATRAANQRAAAESAAQASRPATDERETLRGLLDQLRAAREAGNTDRVNQLMPEIRAVASRVRQAEAQAREGTARDAGQRSRERR